MANTRFKGPIVVTGTGTSSNAGNQTVAGTLAVGGGTAITKIVKGTVAVDLASMLTLTTTEVTLTITGAVLGDTVIMNPVAAGNTAGLIYGGARVSAADTVKMRVFNGSAGTVDEASQVWEYALIRA